MGCETKVNCKDIWGLGIVLPKVAKVVVGILGSGSRYPVQLCILGIPSTTLLRYVLWAFASCITTFRYCKLVISIDGTHLYGKYRGVLLIAMATDANNKVFPLSFIVVNRELGPSWGGF